MVDDNLGLRELLEISASEWNVGEWKGGAGSLAEAREWLSQNEMPSVLLLDVRLPDGRGWELLDGLSAEATAQTAVAFTTATRDEGTLIHVARKRVKGFIDKSTARLVDWREALELLTEGKTYFSSGVLTDAKRLISHPDHWTRILTGREVQLVHRFGTGLSNVDVGLDLGISAQTVQVHRKNIMKKLGLHRTVDLVNWSRKNGLTE